jgi:environmental stress-induced protein Ves
MYISKIIPDIEFQGSGNSNDNVNLVLKGRRYPTEAQSTLSSNSLTASTNYKNTRGRTRQVAVRIENSDGDFKWRLGDTRFEIRPDGGK